jgi:hypothetical protein
MRNWKGALLIAGALGAMAADCDNSQVCSCSFCAAVSLSVIDRANRAVIDWEVAAEHDGAPVDTSPCSSLFRTTNTCVLGTDPGIYTVVVSSAGRPPVEAVVRQVATFDCCTTGLCTTPEPLVVVLDDPAE